jgi:hypothetical protein
MPLIFDSQTRYGKNEPFDLQVSRGQIPGHRVISYSGFNNSIDSNQATVWPRTGRITYPSAAVTMTVSSDSASDTSAGIGARTVLIEGLDANYIEISDTITLNGQTGVNTPRPYLRVNRMIVLTAGSTFRSQGQIFIGVGVINAGVPATVYNLIPQFDNNLSQTMAFCIPAGHTGYVSSIRASFGNSATNNYLTALVSLTGQNGIRRSVAGTTGEQGVALINTDFPISVTEKTDFEMYAFDSGNGGVCTAGLSVLLIKNEQ